MYVMSSKAWAVWSGEASATPAAANLVPLAVLADELHSQADDDQDEQRVAPQVGGERDELARGLMAFPRGPDDEVEGDGDLLLGLAGDVAGDEGQGEGLGGPEGEGDVIADEQADVLGEGLVGGGS